jgi:hypothetical protein
VAGNIGARRVQTVASVLERLIHARLDEVDLNAGKKQVAAALDPIVQQLKAALDATKSEAPALSTLAATSSPEQSREVATRLQKLLSEFDPGAADFIETNRTALDPLFVGDAWAPFEKMVQDYSFAEAQSRLEEVLKKQFLA